MSSIFTQIIEGNIPGHFVWKDEHAVAIMTIQPTRPGHVLVIPREETDHWNDLSGDLLSHVMVVSQKIAVGLKQAFPAARVGMLIAGLEVPHTHIHLIPLDDMSDFDLGEGAMADQADLVNAAEKVRQALLALGHAEAVV